MIKLGVNVDHVATIRQARQGMEPNPLEAAFIAEKAGAQGITVHLREDKRHIQEFDVRAIQDNVILPLNLEMSLSTEIVKTAIDIKPHFVTLVPEKREELTTEGGLDVVSNFDRLKQVVEQFKEIGINTSLFIDPNFKQIEAANKVGADFIELHTGDYANNYLKENEQYELDRLKKGASFAVDHNLRVNAGHGLNYVNVLDILKLEGLEELNIGHSIVSRAIMTGFFEAVKEMVSLISLK